MSRAYLARGLGYAWVGDFRKPAALKGNLHCRKDPFWGPVGLAEERWVTALTPRFGALERKEKKLSSGGEGCGWGGSVQPQVTTYFPLSHCAYKVL